MCPSFRALRQEQHSPRGRANSLRLALAGQLGEDAMASDALHETMATCVGCKACRIECPQAIDIARMKVEVLGHHRSRHGMRLRERLIAALPLYAGAASRFATIVNGLSALPGSSWLRERFLGFSADRSLPRWSSNPFTRSGHSSDVARSALNSEHAVLLWADTFNNHFDPDVLHAARRVLEAAGKTVIVASPAPGDPEPRRPLCCGRTWLAAGQVERARVELVRTIDALSDHGLESLPVVGLEPACLFTFRDEALALGLGERAGKVAARAVMFEEYLARERGSGRLDLPLSDQSGVTVHCHFHCHQKAFGTASQSLAAMQLLPGATVKAIESGCCGMAGAFGFQSEMQSVSKAIASLDLLPALERLPDEAIIVADGSSCRHLIRDDAERTSWHVAQILDRALGGRIDGRSAVDLSGPPGPG
jgi:Fe-S oxidoreductase